VAAILTLGDDGNEMKENQIVEVEGGEHAKNKWGGSTIRQTFKFFQETDQSIHGPKGEERSQLVPYFL